jgi:UDP-N-acetylmuramate--alanine ligase
VNSDVVHFVGIGGIGMSALARLVLARGAAVTGSDLRSSGVTDALAALGATIAIGQRAENVGAATRVVVSTAIAADNPELLAARERGLDVVTRGALLAELTRGHRTIAIAGTHGKTTTTAMTTAILEAAGLAPTFAIGGLRVETDTNAGAGAGTWFVTEADESDGSFLHLTPAIAVVTNVENDHLASDDEFPALVDAFATFVARVPSDGCAIFGSDNPVCATLAGAANVPRATFATRVDADLVAREIVYDGLHARFTLVERGTALGPIALAVPGEINVRNALAAIAAARAAGVGYAPIAAALAAFRGVRRRFEIVAEHDGLVVVDDYAHHPTAVAETIAAARAAGDLPVVVAFQPHRYTRTRYLAADFATALSAADRVVLAPVYAASEAPIPGVSERSIGEPLARAGTPVDYVDDVEALVDVMPRIAGGRAIVLMLGAGNISSVAHRLGERLRAVAVG